MGTRALTLTALVVTAACGACDAGVRVLGYGRTGGSGGTGTGGGGTAALVGRWRNVTSLTLSSGEVVVFDVRWTFGADGRCDRTRIQTLLSGSSGSETSESIACTYTPAAASVTVTFEGSSVPSRFSVAFSGGDLLLDGTRFTRIG